ncbi:hypothetical protein J5690_09885 [bacterium]|nr:hypothetical protein [bacterium]
MKKVLIFITMMLAAATLFAETETMTCESEAGTCVYELDGTVFHEYCTCNGGSYDKTNNHSNSAAMPTELECSKNTDADVYCKEGNFACDNDAGRCNINHTGEYFCSCWGVWSANGAVEGGYHGTAEFVEESCGSKLVEICGTEPATARDVCEDQEILNQCISYIKAFADGCFEPLSDEDIEGILDQQAYGFNKEWSHQLSDCCQMEQYRTEIKTNLECFENCKDDNCCDTCRINPVIHDDDTDAANTEVPTTGTTPEDKADGDSPAPATGSEAPAEKEESKSDGCSMLFI